MIATLALRRQPRCISSIYQAVRRTSSLNKTHVGAWLQEHAASFAPPVMNKLLHREQLSIMFVGGPNQREDFHLEEGSEFFYQIRGNMELPILHGGKRETITIREGEVFLLPSRIPHSPQRPEAGSIGLVVERQRYEHEPPDGLRFYTDFETCEHILWERYFQCYDLGKDLAPIVAAFNASEEKATRRPSRTSVLENPPLVQDIKTTVPPPFSLTDWLARNADHLRNGASLNLFEGHPDREFTVLVEGGMSERTLRTTQETWLFQLSGSATLMASNEEVHLGEDECVVLPAGQDYTLVRPSGSLGLNVMNDPLGNKR
jgi:3-hydroxyanthranilate 3,4-dioxygenase